MFKKLAFVIFCVSTFSCNTVGVSKDFESVATQFVTDFRPLFPDEGPLSMDNDFLAKLPIPTPAYLDSVRRFQQTYSTELATFDRSVLPSATLRNVEKVDNMLKSIHSFLNDCQRNPQRFNVLNGFRRIIRAEYASDDYRARVLLSKLGQVPLFYATAKERLRAVDRQAADASVEQHLATFLFFDTELPQFFEQNGRLTPPQYQAEIEAAKLAVKDYVAFVESFRLN